MTWNYLEMSDLFLKKGRKLFLFIRIHTLKFSIVPGKYLYYLVLCDLLFWFFAYHEPVFAKNSLDLLLLESASEKDLEKYWVFLG
jgi:hypothetical protein